MPNLLTRKPDPNPKNMYHIGGIPVEFPYKPYGTQLAFMGRVISTLDRALNDGHCHALLESPTGTGKSLSLLCSALSWQKHRGSLNPNPNRADPRAGSDPLNHGGGFVPDSQISETSTPEAAPPATNSKKKKTVPTIFYASRTHSQISQVIREYRKTTYRVPMAILASRKHYCTNPNVRGGDNLDEECKLLLENKEAGCSYFKNVHKVKNHPLLQKGGCHEPHDIEDLVKVGNSVKGCSYFAARAMADDAQIVFCPYSYIINPIIRRAMEVDIKGAILILDEAHNIEDMARDAGSMDADVEALQKLQIELGQLCGIDAQIYQPLYEVVQDIISWIERRKDNLEKRDFQHYFSCWTGDKALRELQEANLSQQCFPILQECATKAIKAASDFESGLPHLSGMSAITLEGLFSSLSYFFHGDGSHIHDYQLVLQRCVIKDAVDPTGRWTLTLGLWCLNPAVVFRDIANLSLSVILTSGTLSPLNSFSSELGIPFGTTLEAQHVIDVESQVWASVVPTGPCHYPLNASYKTADQFAFQDAVGKSLEEMFKVIPGGSLVFFPSYKLMEKLCKRWRETGQWLRLNKRKTLFTEPRGGAQEDFEGVLKAYYGSIRQGRKPSIGKRRKAKKVDVVSDCTSNDSSDISREGAAFLGVCRGKVSEGIDFSDDNARAVIIVGIPFPNINDVQVAEKKKYNDAHKHSKNLLGGSEWYCQQAFRALNQAAGRCIRHKSDYGAVIFLDERFREDRNTAYISKWLRKSIRTYENFEKSVEELKSFFCNIKETVGKANMSQDSVHDLENIPPDSVNGFIKQKRPKNNKVENKTVFDSTMMTSNSLSHCLSFKTLSTSGSMKVKSQSEGNIQQYAPVPFEDTDNCHKASTNANCCYQPDFRCESPQTASLNERLELSVVRETPMAENGSLAYPEASIDDGYSNSTIIQTYAPFGQPNSAAHSIDITPERNPRGSTEGFLPEIESSVNLSVNSHAQKRRISLYPPSVNNTLEMKFDEAGYSVGESMSNRRTKCTLNSNSSRCEARPNNVSSVVKESASNITLNQHLQVLCTLCQNPLGCPENNSYVTCCLTSMSKVVLTSISAGKLTYDRQISPAVLPVVIVESSCVDHRVFDSKNDDITGQGIWCKEDGCVYNTVFCPFCISRNCVLGVHIVATDASNLHLINKIIFLRENVEVKSNQEIERKEALMDKGSPPNENFSMNSFAKYAYQSPQQSSGGWRTTKPKSRILKRSSN